jgi:AraC family transcriptional regulator
MGVPIELASSRAVADPLAAALRLKSETGARGAATTTRLAAGDGWQALEFLCTSGPCDRPYEDAHAAVSITLVRAGLFVYRSHRGLSLMSPGALVLGRPGETFASFYRHGEGSHCLSFRYDPALYEDMARDLGSRGFVRQQLPPLPALAPVLARAERAGSTGESLEEIALALAGAVARLAGSGRDHQPCGRDRARIAGVLHLLSETIGERHDLAALARTAGLSRYHFLRTFKRVTGVTPHQWLLRTRLRRAAARLADGGEPVTHIALEVGFPDLANFIRAFRREFGVSPGRYR